MKRYFTKDALAWLILLALTACFFGWSGAALHSGHNWGDDFGAYLQIARNILEGRPMLDRYSGIDVPVGYPLVLVGWMSLFGDDFRALKFLNVTTWAAVAFTTYSIGREVMGRLPSLGAAALVLVVPFYFLLQQTVGTDIPAAFPFVLSAYFMLRFARPLRLFNLGDETMERLQYRWLVVSLLALFATLMMRPAAVSLSAGLAVGLALTFLTGTLLGGRIWPVRLHHTSRQDWAAALLGIGLVLVVTGVYLALFGNSTSDHLTNANNAKWFDISNLSAQIVTEIYHMRLLILAYPADNPSAWSVSVLLLFALLIYAVCEREYILPMITFATISMLVLLPWDHSPRLSLHLSPFYAIFTLYGLTMLAKTVRALADRYLQGALRKVGWAGPVLSALIFAALMETMQDRSANLRNFDDEEISKPDAVAVMDWLRTNTTVDQRTCSFKPRAFMYLTDRSACWLNPYAIPETLGPILKELDGEFAVLLDDPVYATQAEAVARLSSDPTVREVYRNPNFVVVQRVDTP